MNDQQETFQIKGFAGVELELERVDGHLGRFVKIRVSGREIYLDPPAARLVAAEIRDLLED